jgi:hypothetical protein
MLICTKCVEWTSSHSYLLGYGVEAPVAQRMGAPTGGPAELNACRVCIDENLLHGLPSPPPAEPAYSDTMTQSMQGEREPPIERIDAVTSALQWETHASQFP